MDNIERKALQSDEDARQTGLEQLQNWGAMLRGQGNFGPAGFKASPMFRDCVSRYANEEPSIRESFRADEAYVVMDLINYLVRDEYELICVYLFYAESSTHSNLKETVERYNKIAEREGREGIGPTRMRSILTSVEIKVGTGLIIFSDGDEWLSIAKLMQTA